MDRKILGLLAAVAIVASACGAAAVSSSPAHRCDGPDPRRLGRAVRRTVAHPARLRADPVRLRLQAGARARAGGSIVVSDWQAANQLNPVISTSLANSYVFAATMRALFTVTADGHWKPDLASKMPKFSDKSIRVDADGKGFEMDIELKPGLLWSDGEPADAERPQVHLAVGQRSGPGRRHDHRLGLDRQDRRRRPTGSRRRSTSRSRTPATTACSGRRSCPSTG